MRYYSLKGISSCHGSLIAIATMALHPASLVFCFITHDDLVLERLECKGGLVVRNSFEAPKIVAVPSKKKNIKKNLSALRPPTRSRQPLFYVSLISFSPAYRLAKRKNISLRIVSLLSMPLLKSIYTCGASLFW